MAGPKLGQIDFYVMPGSGLAPRDAEKMLRYRGVTVRGRRIVDQDPDTKIRHCRVMVSPRQHKWAEEILFVAGGWSPAGPVLPATAARMEEIGPAGYDFASTWSDRMVGAGGLQGLIYDALAPLFGSSRRDPGRVGRRGRPRRRVGRVGRVGRVNRLSRG